MVLRKTTHLTDIYNRFIGNILSYKDDALWQQTNHIYTVDSRYYEVGYNDIPAYYDAFAKSKSSKYSKIHSWYSYYNDAFFFPHQSRNNGSLL